MSWFETVAGVAMPDHQWPLSDTRAEVPVLESRTAGIAYFETFRYILVGNFINKEIDHD